MRILHLTLKKRWFNMIYYGNKREEYRELKDYWGNRLCFKAHCPRGGYLSKWAKLREGDMECLKDDFIPNFEKFDIVRFKNGYASDAPTFDIEFKGISIGSAKPEWSDNFPDQAFIIKLGNILTKIS